VVVGPQDGPWGAVVAAVDGSLEVRVSPPRKRFWQRETDASRWLREHDFVFGVDAWHAPLPAATPDEDAAQLLAAALEAAHGAQEPTRTFEARGVHEDDRPAPGAAHEVHVAAALRTLVDGRQRGAIFGGGRPEVLWAYVWADEGELLVEREERGNRESGTDVWRAPLTNVGCESAANELLRRTRADWPDADAVPLFIQLLDHDK
jgi:hypothetical protein